PQRAQELQQYHRKRAAALAKLPLPPGALPIAQTGGGIKGGIGGGIGGIGGGMPGGFGGFGGGIAGGVPGGVATAPPAINGGGSEGPLEQLLAAHPGLAFDTQVNETVRRRRVHDELAGRGRVRPEEIKHWLFKYVLKADLDDPLLGLGEVLNRNYPFAG